MTGLVNASFATRTVSLSPTPHMMLVKAHFEGALEFLDQPGEWALGEDDFVYAPTAFLPLYPSVFPLSLLLLACGGVDEWVGTHNQIIACQLPV